MSSFCLHRRRGILAGSLLAAGVALPALAQSGRHKPAGPSSLMVAQLVDTSASEQDIAKDFLIGARAAWQDINANGGLRGRTVQHLAIEVDGSVAGLQAAAQAVLDNPDCLVLSGTVSDPAASQLTQLLQARASPLAHVAPWLQNSSMEVGDSTFPIFAGRREQIVHALRTMAVSGIQEVGVVFASDREHAWHQQDIASTAAVLRLKMSAFRGAGDLVLLGQRLGPRTPAVLLFIGGTPELVRFTTGLDRQSRQRFVIALADVNLQTVLQMGGARTTPIIATQVVPLLSAALPVVLRGIDGAPSRAAALAAFQRRPAVDLGGYRISFDAQRRSAGYVTQSMLTSDGRVVG
jgi:hypothetical protein